jgi:copper chaperone CopZ
MSRRSDLRVISARIRDLHGVVGVEADLITRTIRIYGKVEMGDVRAAIAGAGYEVAG